MKLFMSVISLCLLIGSAFALQWVIQKGLQSIGVPITIHHCPTFAKSCYTASTIDSMEHGCSTDSVEENICEISYDGGLNLSPVRILQVHPSIETCWCNKDLCNSDKSVQWAPVQGSSITNEQIWTQ